MENESEDLYGLFMEELEDMLSSEAQIIKALPKLIKLATTSELKKGLSDHLEETKGQVERLKEIFSLLDEPVKKKKCEGMEGILEEGDEMVKSKTKSPALDAAIISACQKVEHYEIASYGTLKSFAKHLKMDKEVVDLLQANLDEEGAADKKLTKIAQGSTFTSGVNEKAAAGTKKKK